MKSEAWSEVNSFCPAFIKPDIIPVRSSTYLLLSRRDNNDLLLGARLDAHALSLDDVNVALQELLERERLACGGLQEREAGDRFLVNIRTLMARVANQRTL